MFLCDKCDVKVVVLNKRMVNNFDIVFVEFCEFFINKSSNEDIRKSITKSLRNWNNEELVILHTMGGAGKFILK